MAIRTSPRPRPPPGCWCERLGLSEGEWSHCYQSRFGRVEWLKPYAVDTIAKLAAQGVRNLTVASPAFAVDCLETLEEIAVEYRDLFRAKGGERLALVPGLNDGDDHVAALCAGHQGPFGRLAGLNVLHLSWCRVASAAPAMLDSSHDFP